MLNNKRAMSAVVTTVIMVGLVIVAVGIVWAVVMNIIEGEAEDIDYSQQCIGINMNIESLDCNGASCTVELKRALGSKTDAIGGIGITVKNSTKSSSEYTESGNIAVTRIIDVPTDIIATGADVRVYIEKADETEYWCSTVSSYP